MVDIDITQATEEEVYQEVTSLVDKIMQAAIQQTFAKLTHTDGITSAVEELGDDNTSVLLRSLDENRAELIMEKFWKTYSGTDIQVEHFNRTRRVGDERVSRCWGVNFKDLEKVALADKGSSTSEAAREWSLELSFLGIGGKFTKR
jgi:hypothetical protein